MDTFRRILAAAVEGGASDIHLKVGGPIIFRMSRKLVVVEGPEPTVDWMDAVLDNIVPKHSRAQLDRDHECDFSYFLPNVGRFRTNCFYQRGSPCLAMRFVKTQVPTFEELGLLPILRQIAETPRGVVLVAGSTGSGKSTTLAAMLEHVNANSRKHVVTLEDPIEFVFEDNQSIIEQREVGLDTASFAQGLKSVLRQDPDIIMIGEIRDTETAEIAVEAALTGHQVLSTMHCNDAPGAMARMDDMGIAPFLISSSVILSCAQRLMRRICSHCKEPVTYPARMYEDLGIEPAMFDGVQLYRGRGCERCKSSGYSGRLAIIEVMTVSDQIRKLIIARASTREVGKLAINQGMKTLRMVALDRARDGISTLEQVLVTTSGF